MGSAAALVHRPASKLLTVLQGPAWRLAEHYFFAKRNTFADSELLTKTSVA